MDDDNIIGNLEGYLLGSPSLDAEFAPNYSRFASDDSQIIKVDFNSKQRIGIVSNNSSNSNYNDYKQQDEIRAIVGDKLYNSIEDIVVNGKVVQNSNNRANYLMNQCKYDNEYKQILNINNHLNKLGRRLNFKDRGSYSEIYSIIDQIESETQRGLILEFMPSIFEIDFISEEHYNFLSSSMLIKSTQLISYNKEYLVYYSFRDIKCNSKTLFEAKNKFDSIIEDVVSGNL